MTETSPTIAPYGSWVSPVTPALLVEKAVGLSNVTVNGRWVYWVEARPSEAGRMVLVRASLGGHGTDAAEVLPASFSVRTQVHEYGGRCYAVGADGTVVFSSWADQRLWVMEPGGGEPRPLTPEPAEPRSERYADPVIHPSGRTVICVRERHLPEGVVNDLVAVALGDRPETPDQPAVLADGHDFYAAPRVSPEGDRLAWISWDHPAMPWDATLLHVAPLDPIGASVGPSIAVAGGPDESVTQPRWSPDGVLHYASDRSGWWNIYGEGGEARHPLDAEFAEPDWVFGNSSYGFDPAGRLVATWSTDAGRAIGVDGQAVAFPFTSFSSVCPIEGGAVVVAASPTSPPVVAVLTWDGDFRVLKRSRDMTLPAGSVSVPEPIDFPTGGGQVAHALVYLPANEHYAGPDGERPPVMVVIHGGPTSSASGVFNLAYQFWTTRGFAVADVDYRGSSGYGRAYRRMLDGVWGVADVEDCAAVVAELDRRGWVDGRRAVIRGGSAGGFTTLAALAFTDAFAAGASHYGVADLELLARDTHKFEARYLDGLVGPYPADADVYRRRSPIHHVEQITNPLILFQGLEDQVVPPAQSQMMFDALAERGVPVAYLAFEGEQHGFRQASTVTRVVAAELTFYGRVLGFTPDLPDDPPLEIVNAPGAQGP